jgi:hypothetical protein
MHGAKNTARGANTSIQSRNRCMLLQIRAVPPVAFSKFYV